MSGLAAYPSRCPLPLPSSACVSLDEIRVDRPARLLLAPDHDLDPGVEQRPDAPAAHPRIWIDEAHYHLGDARVDERARTGRGASEVITRFKGDVRGAPSRLIACGAKGEHLGVGFSGFYGTPPRQPRQTGRRSRTPQRGSGRSCPWRWRRAPARAAHVGIVLIGGVWCEVWAMGQAGGWVKRRAGRKSRLGGLGSIGGQKSLVECEAQRRPREGGFAQAVSVSSARDRDAIREG